MSISYDGIDILALEAAAAKEANMSYGKWKAMGGKIDPDVDRPLLKGWHKCRRCGKPFKPKKGCRQLYCHPDCQYEAQKDRNRDKNRERARAYQARKRAMAAKIT